MSWFEPREILCPAGEWTTLLTNIAAGMPRHWEVRFQAEGGELRGRWVVERSPVPLGIGLRTRATGELAPQVSFERGWFDASFRIRVFAEVPLRAWVD